MISKTHMNIPIKYSKHDHSYKFFTFQNQGFFFKKASIKRKPKTI